MASNWVTCSLAETNLGWHWQSLTFLKLILVSEQKQKRRFLNLTWHFLHFRPWTCNKKLSQVLWCFSVPLGRQTNPLLQKKPRIGMIVEADNSPCRHHRPCFHRCHCCRSNGTPTPQHGRAASTLISALVWNDKTSEHRLTNIHPIYFKWRPYIKKAAIRRELGMREKTHFLIKVGVVKFNAAQKILKPKALNCCP